VGGWGTAVRVCAVDLRLLQDRHRIGAGAGRLWRNKYAITRRGSPKWLDGSQRSCTGVWDVFIIEKRLARSCIRCLGCHRMLRANVALAGSRTHRQAGRG